jgi:two-component system, cell cycle sensor histidine kinase and response regulator CckA
MPYRMQFQAKSFARLPIARKMLVIVALFVVIVICVSFLATLRSEILTSIRAYVGGEGLWSKAEKRAVLSLTDYAQSRRESDYQQYLAEIAVPEGDKIARLQLSSPSPDMDLVAKGFIQGRNHPDDVGSMANLFRRFHNVGYMAKAIAIWTEGDAYIEQLQLLAAELHREIQSPHPDEQQIQQIAIQIATIDGQLTPLEDAFSSTLSEGARWINKAVSILSLAITALLLLIGITLSSVVLNQIRNSEEKYRTLINTANDAILVIDAEKRTVLEANSKAFEMLSIPEDRLIGMAESELYAVREGDSSSALTPMLSQRGELELRRANGSLLPVDVSASRTELGGRPAILAIFRDIRERREAAAILRRSEERFGHLIENLSDVITVVAVDSTMVYHSPSVERVAGYRASTLLGKSFLSFVHPQDQAAVRAAFEKVTLKTGTATPPEFRFRHNNGSWIWLESVANNLLNDVAVGGIVVISRDVTGRRMLEEQVRQSQKMEAVGRLAGGIAHDFNNLLMVIRGYGEIVLQEVTAIPSVVKNVETIVRTSERAASLTRQLLSFSRKHVFSPQVLDLNDLVNRMSEMLLGVLREEMEMDVKLDPDAGCISADAGQIEQVIMNLVVNARDAMPKGGKLTLQTVHMHSKAIRASRQLTVPSGEYVMLAVSDTGVGMDPETQSRIFEPFFTTKSKDAGTGLGLSVVYNIVRGTGGQVRVNSELGKGTTLEIFFPRVFAHPKAELLQVPSASSRVGAETILVAEDQPDLRWMICQFLQELGYSVLEAKDGADAVELAEQYRGPIDVLLSDVVMPHVRGPEVARRLCAIRRDMKVIFMSGYTEGEFGAGDKPGPELPILQKPFELDSLAGKIREVLEARTRS